MKTLFITGASRGLGAMFVQAALQRGDNVVAAARSPQAIAERFGSPKNLLPVREGTAQHPAFRLIPVFSAGVILCIGLLMTGASLGVINVRV